MFANRIAVKLAFFLNGFIYANWVSRLPRIQEIFHADDGTIGIVLLSISLGAVVAMPFAGWVIMKNGSRRITLASVIAYCAFVPLIPVAPDIIALTILFFVMGAITGVLDVAMNAQAVMVEQAYKKPIMSSFHALFSIGMALGAWCGALFVDLETTLVNHFAIVGGSALATTLWMSKNLIADSPSREIKTEGPLFRLPNKSLIGIGIIAFCCMMGEGAMADWTVNYMENIAFAADHIAPLALSSFAAAMTIGRIFGDRARSAWGDDRLIVFGGLLAVAGLAVSLLFPEPMIVITGLFFVGLGLSAIVPITYSIAGSTKGLPQGAGIAMVTTIGYSGFLFGPPIIGFISDLSNLRVGLTLLILLFVVMTVLGTKVKRA